MRRRFGVFLMVALGVVLITTGLSRSGGTIGVPPPTCGAVEIGVQPACPEGVINITDTNAPAKPSLKPPTSWQVDVSTTNCTFPQGGTTQTVTVPNQATGTTTSLYLFNYQNNSDPCVYSLVERQVTGWTPTFNPPSPVTILNDNQTRASSHEDVTLTNTAPPLPPRPNTAITKTTINKKRHTVRFSFKANQNGATFTCAFAKSGHKRTYHKCASPKTYRKLKKGHYLFTVRATGKGGTDKTPARKKIHIKAVSHH